MSALQNRLWDWATASFIRLGTVLLALHTIANRKGRHG